MRVLNKINVLWGVFVGALTMVFGQYWYLFAAFLVANIVDYLTGVAKARFTKTENSNKGTWGIIKKVGYWVVIAIAFFVANCFGELGKIVNVDLGVTMLLGWFTLATFLINEIRSILENLVVMGVYVPDFLAKGLEVASKLIDKSGGS